MSEKTNVTKLTKSEDIGYNPMVNDEFIILVNKVVAKNSYKIGNEGELIPVEVNMESEAFTKVYTKAEYRIYVANLSDCALRLWVHLVFECDSGEDVIKINTNRYMKENHIKSINTYKTAIKELHRYLFICPSVIKGVYWINPRLFFAGSRVNKYPKNVVVK